MLADVALRWAVGGGALLVFGLLFRSALRSVPRALWLLAVGLTAAGVLTPAFCAAVFVGIARFGLGVVTESLRLAGL